MVLIQNDYAFPMEELQDITVEDTNVGESVHFSYKMQLSFSFKVIFLQFIVKFSFYRFPKISELQVS